MRLHPGFCRRISMVVILGLPPLPASAVSRARVQRFSGVERSVSAESNSDKASSVDARLTAQNLLFKQQFEDDMKASPQTATAYGDYRRNALLDERSLASEAEENATDLKYRAKLQAISTEGFPEQDRISHDLLL